MLQIAATGSLAEVVTVMLPCAWIYAVIGEHFTALGEPPAGHPYHDWLAMYANPDFAAVGAWLRAVVDDEAARMDDRGRQRLRDIFRTSSEYEWLFWQMAWTREEALSARNWQVDLASSKKPLTGLFQPTGPNHAA